MAATLDPLEKSILDGTFFRGPRTPSPTRSASTASNASSSPSSSRSPSPAGMPAGAPLRTSGPQTGPKGVKADRDHARQVEREARRAERKARDGELSKRAVVAGDWRVQERLQREEDTRRRDGAGPSASSSRVGGSRKQEEDDLDLDDLGLDDDEDDDEALQRYRRARILELQGGGQAGASSSSAASSSRPIGGAGPAQYGRLIEVDGDSYSTEIDDVPPGTSVVVHIYSDLSPTCPPLNLSLTSLAQLHPTTKFLQVPAWEIGFGITTVRSDDDHELDELDVEEMEREAAEVTPTLLIYRDGRLVGNLVRVDLLSREEGGVGKGGEEMDVIRSLRLFGAVSGA